ncbi:hypothetical protein AciX8_2978 [Granulicella mallensis MP5ACTX8]|uniref:Uncharacterized protein n=1 Tax=Granulicella mallensis (strain ATCC BAA-1857 / DSM 23137 / MP5ACTX8) TaxID=682795 RepID=G8NQQ5_GRAMM|nr:hypothetical protein AciX8_2978 [Granulicella mallensis MP5ACTX8]
MCPSRWAWYGELELLIYDGVPVGRSSGLRHGLLYSEKRFRPPVFGLALLLQLAKSGRKQVPRLRLGMSTRKARATAKANGNSQSGFPTGMTERKTKTRADVKSSAGIAAYASCSFKIRGESQGYGHPEHKPGRAAKKPVVRPGARTCLNAWLLQGLFFSRAEAGRKNRV